MWVLLPLISIILTTDLLREKHTRYFSNIRTSVIATLIFHAAFIFISTEILSLFNLINALSVKLLWTLMVLLLSLYYFKSRSSTPSRKKKNIKKYFGENRLISFATLFIILISLITCLFAYPNTWDSMTYHLPRVMHWIQNGNVDHYPTHNDRQLGLSPLGEYCDLHIKLLSSYDPLLNLVQWISMVGSVIASSLITKECGGKKRMQIITAFFTAAIPMGILQSNSTQNDYVVGFFIVCTILYLIKGIKSNFSISDLMLFIICCCLAVTAKGTSFVFLLPVVFIWIILAVIKLRLKIIKPALIGLLFVGIFCLPQFIRNSNTFNSPLGADYKLSNEAYGIAPTLSNMSKNAAIHLKTPFPPINKGIENAVLGFNDLININVQSDKYNWRFTPPFEVSYISTQEDSAGNFLHVILFIICFLVFLFNKNLRKNKKILLVMGIGLLMFITFCTLLKWQIWNCRLMLPMFLVITPFLAFMVHSITSKLLFASIMFLFFCSSCLFLFVNQSRLWFGPESIFTASATDQYFNNNDKLKLPFVEITDMVQNSDSKKVGFVTSGDAWQYPFWILLQHSENLVIQQVMVNNASAKIESSSQYNTFIPDVIISNKINNEDTLTLPYKSNIYILAYKNETWSLYKNAKSPK